MRLASRNSRTMPLLIAKLTFCGSEPVALATAKSLIRPETTPTTLPLRSKRGPPQPPAGGHQMRGTGLGLSPIPQGRPAETAYSGLLTGSASLRPNLSPRHHAPTGRPERQGDHGQTAESIERVRCAAG